MKKVLVVATSHKTRGGITSVIKAHKTGEQWKKYHCKWIETHRDGNAIIKLLYFFVALAEFILLIPFYDLIHIHMAVATRKIPFILLAKFLHKKIIIHLHVPDPNTTILSNKKNLYGWCLKNADIVITLSSQWEKLIKDTYQIQNVITIYNPCPIVKQSDKPKEKIILYAGTISERKGYKDLLYSFASIVSKYPDWKVYLAGNGEIDKGNKLAKKLNIEKQVFFIGWVNGLQKDEIFNKASIFCLPSYAEGFPMAVLDAWAYGIPVICTPVGGLPDIIKDGKNCLSFKPGNRQELTQKLETLIDDDRLREKLHSESLLLANTTFNIKNINKQIEEIYNNLLYDNR